jgi:hypothetical protein
MKNRSIFNMNILNEINQAGVSISLDGERIKVSNPSYLTDKLRNLIHTNKQEIVSQLARTSEAKSNELLQDIREHLEERAAIMEYDGGLSRHDAEQAATKAIRVYCYRMTDKPYTELTVIMPNTEFDEAIEKMKNKYGDHLLDVYPSPYCMDGTLANNTKH